MPYSTKTLVTLTRWHTHSFLSLNVEENVFIISSWMKKLMGHGAKWYVTCIRIFLWDNFIDLSYSGCIHVLKRRQVSEDGKGIWARSLSISLYLVVCTAQTQRWLDNNVIWMGIFLFWFILLLFESRNQKDQLLEIIWRNTGLMSLSRIC